MPVIRFPGAGTGGQVVTTARDIEAEYVDILASMSPQQLWALGLHGTACALVAAERGSTLAGSPDEMKVARELLFDREAERRNCGVDCADGWSAKQAH